jgi:maleylacetoacetate isomerase
MKLYSYFRSSGAYRVRIALNLKGIPYELQPVNLPRNEQFTAEFQSMNPQALVPVLEDGANVLVQSLAIVDYLDETYPKPPFLPVAPAARAWVRSIALAIACEIHPLNNLRVLRYLTGPLGVSEEAKNTWYHHWVKLGLQAVEERLSRSSVRGSFCYGDAPGLADIFLIPQLANGRRYNVDLSGFTTLLRIEENCMRLPAFQRAAPSAQPDAE